ncbi:hypothetical protein [Helicobacter mastomyrinus]|uniref:Uncharacterized protein n=1 Tax=Helicobacter mastomyrinus TaxID=287948 RepID=A0ABZ3F8P8_9HELI|nr:hypothetical protein [uncultured Helicobacter sp.]
MIYRLENLPLKTNLRRKADFISTKQDLLQVWISTSCECGDYIAVARA